MIRNISAPLTTPSRSVSWSAHELYVTDRNDRVLISRIFTKCMLVQSEAAPPLSLLDLCSRTNKNKRWETMTGVEPLEILPAGARNAAVGARTPESFSLSFTHSATTSSTQRFLYGAKTHAHARTLPTLPTHTHYSAHSAHDCMVRPTRAHDVHIRA
jgi:hypothetical protein